MAFYGSTFIFDGIPCEEYGLMIYNFDSQKQSDADIASTGSIVTEHIPRGYRNFIYGVQQDSPLKFNMVFGGTRFDTREHLDRFEIDAISSWLTGHNTYKWLEICQPDLENVRYRCIITGLKLLTDGTYPWAFYCDVTCDGPYAYEYPEQVSYSISKSSDICLTNRSSSHIFYYPKMEILFSGDTDLKIINHSDNDRLFEFSGMPNGNPLKIIADNENETIFSSIDTINPYEFFNYNFFRMVRGDNFLTINGTAKLTFIFEFPSNTGG